MKTIWTLIFLVTPWMAQAQPPEDKDWWACQSVENSGAIWEGGQWKPRTFKLNDRFILIGEGAGVTKASVTKVLGVKESDLECQPAILYGETYCFVWLTGTSFGFSAKTGNGAIGRIYGGLDDGAKRDTINVKAFECAKG